MTKNLSVMASSPVSPIFSACNIEKLGMGPGNEANESCIWIHGSLSDGFEFVLFTFQANGTNYYTPATKGDEATGGL